MKQLEICRMKPDDLQLALNWAKIEGWNPGLYDSKSFYESDPNGFFIALLNNQPIAVASMVCYDTQFSFFGLYIVKPEFRAQGYGLQLTQECLKYAGNRISGLDGVLTQVDKYARLGYQKSYLTTRHIITAPIITSEENPAIICLKNISINEIVAYETSLFPAKRPLFLQNWINQPESHAFGYYSQKQLQGYGVVRRCHVGYKIGPLLADSFDIAEKLFLKLLEKIPGQSVSIDISELNKEAFLLAKKFNLEPGFQTIRMYRNGSPSLDFSRIYGITSLELG